MIATKLREQLLLTQEDLASYIGVSVDTVNNWKHGFSNPQKKNLQALANALQTTMDYLEGNIDAALNHLEGGNECIICGEPLPYGVSLRSNEMYPMLLAEMACKLSDF